MADTRRFTASICVKSDTTRARIELAPAEDYGGPAGMWRARIGRRWLDPPEGGRRYLDAAQLAALVAATLGDEPDLEPEPDLPAGTRVTVTLPGEPGEPDRHTCGWTVTPPIRACDGRWHVGVSVYGLGARMLPAHSLTIHRRPS